MKKKISVFLFAICLTVIFPTVVHACPLCNGGGTTPETVNAYRGITLFLALLPIVGTLGLFWWFRRKMNEVSVEE